VTLLLDSLGGAEGGERGGFHGLGDEGEGTEDVGELGLGQGVEVSDYPTVTGTSVIVSLPKMSMTFTAIV
jgi:hypothetical protein